MHYILLDFLSWWDSYYRSWMGCFNRIMFACRKSFNRNCYSRRMLRLSHLRKFHNFYSNNWLFSLIKCNRFSLNNCFCLCCHWNNYDDYFWKMAKKLPNLVSFQKIYSFFFNIKFKILIKSFLQMLLFIFIHYYYNFNSISITDDFKLLW